MTLPRLKLILLILFSLIGFTLTTTSNGLELESAAQSLQQAPPLSTPTLIPLDESTDSAVIFPIVTVAPTYPTLSEAPANTPLPALPIVKDLSLSATWFYSPDRFSGGCGNTVYLHSPTGEFVQWDTPVVTTISRPDAPPLLLVCINTGKMYGDIELQVFDPLNDSLVALATDNANIVYYWEAGILSPDGRYYLVDGRPSGLNDESLTEQFWGIYRVDLQTGVADEFIRYPYDLTDPTEARWEEHRPLEWNPAGNGLTMIVLAGTDTQRWQAQWEETSTLPYSIAEGSLTLNALDTEIPVSELREALPDYIEPSLPNHITRPILIYRPTPKNFTPPDNPMD